jgi:hypothetical protein
MTSYCPLLTTLLAIPWCPLLELKSKEQQSNSTGNNSTIAHNNNNNNGARTLAGNDAILLLYIHTGPIGIVL